MKSAVSSQPKVAIVYDWLTAGYGGAEVVLQELHELFPEAPLYTSVWNKENTPWLKDWRVETSFLQKFRFLRGNHTLAAPLLPLAFESLDLKSFDIVISVTSFAAKGVLTLPHQLHLSYVLTPPRFLYTHLDAYWQKYQKNSLFSWFTKPLMSYLRRWDQVAARRPDVTIPISKLVAERVKTIYGVTANKPIYPPVPSFTHHAEDLQTKEVDIPQNWWKNVAAQHTPTVKNYLITGGRLVAYKQFDLVLELAEKAQLPLIVFGEGLEMQSLQEKAQNLRIPIWFTGKLAQSKLEKIAFKAQAAIYPAIEDFGITQVQLAQLGVPLILNKHAGAAELLHTIQWVQMVENPTLAELTEALQKLEKVRRAQHVQPKIKNYDTTTFGTEFLAAVLTAWKGIRYE